MKLLKGHTMTVAALVIFAALAGICAALLAKELHGLKESGEAYAALTDCVHLPETAEKAQSAQSVREPETVPESEREAEETEGQPETTVLLPTVDFSALRESAPNGIGWLYLEGTVINYPIVQAGDNSYYLRHLYDGRYNAAGCPFADCDNAPDFSDRNTVVYGHNMKNGSMFAALNGYAEQDFLDAHPALYLLTESESYLAEVYAAYPAKPSEADGDLSPWKLEFTGDANYEAWLASLRERSVIQSGVSVCAADRVLTLSTCLKGDRNKRFLVVCKLTPVTES